MTLASEPLLPASRRLRGSIFSNPLIWLAVALLACCALLTLPLALPIGPMYWDVYIYYDAANRIFDGQTPVLDFFPPVGPLGYYLFAGGVALFPQAQPVLLAHWSLLAVTAPLMALVLWDVQARSRTIALALLVPFLLFALLPFNTREFFPVTGSDAFGIYNRQICQLLYVLVAGLMFMRGPRALAVVITLTMTAMFFLKITGFVAGGMIAAYALASGRVSWRLALASAFAFLALLGILELTTGIVSAYLRDIAILIGKNSGSLLPRFLYSASLNFGVLASTILLAGLVFWIDRQTIRDRPTAILDHNALWLLVVLFAGIFFETQNTGSQAFIFLWPVVLAILLEIGAQAARPAQIAAVAGLAAAISLPPAVNTIERAARTIAAGAKNAPMEARNLKTLGQVTLRPDVSKRADLMLGFYPKYRAFYDEMAAAGETPTQIFYSDFDFQIDYLKAIDDAIDSIRSLETANGIRFDTIGSLNFVNPFPWLMDRSAPKYVAIGADPDRSMPTPGEKEEAAIRDTDLVLFPTCPPTAENMALYKFYEPALASHRRIKLSACYDAFVHPKLASRID